MYPIKSETFFSAHNGGDALDLLEKVGQAGAVHHVSIVQDEVLAVGIVCKTSSNRKRGMLSGLR
jgi:hypothetical protein